MHVQKLVYANGVCSGFDCQSIHTHTKVVVAVILESFFSDWTQSQDPEIDAEESVHGAKTHVYIWTLAFFVCSMYVCACVCVFACACIICVIKAAYSHMVGSAEHKHVRIDKGICVSCGYLWVGGCSFEMNNGICRWGQSSDLKEIQSPPPLHRWILLTVKARIGWTLHGLGST